jgi:hypothetical protein
MIGVLPSVRSASNFGIEIFNGATSTRYAVSPTPSTGL